MEKLIEKIDEYNIFNFILPGIIFTYLLKNYVRINIFQENIIEKIFIYYFIGSIISRFGSIIMEKILRKCKFVKYASYEDYLKAIEKDKGISKLITFNNMYRTFFSGCMLLIILKIAKELFKFWNVSMEISYTILIISIMILYMLSYRKHTKYLKNRIEINK